ncbi:MAG: hypothetical protein ACM32O_15720, partial [Clostridia bacterium]
RQTIEMTVQIWTGFTDYPVFSLVFLDRLLITAMLAFPFGILFWSWVRTWKQKQRKTQGLPENV